MCVVAIPFIMAAIAIVGSVMQNKASNKAMKRQQQALDQQNAIRQEEIADAASAEMNERARAVRKARASARATASEAGINLSSGSFLAQLQAFNAQQDLDTGLVTKNENNRQRARNADYNSGLARIQYKTGLGIATDAAVAGASAYSGAGGSFAYLGNQPGKG